jgi:hypothetical protein
LKVYHNNATIVAIAATNMVVNDNDVDDTAALTPVELLLLTNGYGFVPRYLIITIHCIFQYDASHMCSTSRDEKYTRVVDIWPRVSPDHTTQMIQ